MSGQYSELIKTARKELELADHLLYVTYPLVKEVKFLLSILQHVSKAARTALLALFDYTRYWKEVEPVPLGNFSVEIGMFKNKLQTKYGFDIKYVRLLKKLQETQKYDAESVMRFKRGDKYVLASGDYSSIVTLDEETIKRYMGLSRSFIAQVEGILGRVPE